MIELIVLISDTASAPPSCAARAGWRMSVMLGVSLTMTGMRVFALHQRATISMYSGTWPTAEPMPRSLMPCGQPKFSSMPSAPVSSTTGRIAFQASSSQGTISETTSARSGQSRLTCLISLQVDLQVAVGDQLDVVEAEQPAVGAPDRAVARAVDVDDRRASSPSVFHTTPPQPALKARTTLYSLSVGGAEASQNGFGDLMPTKLVRRSAMLMPSRSSASARWMLSAASRPCATAATVRSSPPTTQSPPAQTLASEVRPSASTSMRPFLKAIAGPLPFSVLGRRKSGRSP